MAYIFNDNKIFVMAVGRHRQSFFKDFIYRVYWAVANNINAMRAEGGLPALTVSSSLSSIADSRCEYLIANDVFSHDGATTAEILCSGATSASAACTGWKNSPSHYSNIMTPGYTQMGIGCIFNTAYGVEVWCVTFS